MYTGVGISVGIGRYFIGIMIPIPTENSVGRFRYYKFGGSLKKLAGAQRRGGGGPLFVHFALLLKKKRNSRGIFQKKSSREFLKRCSRQNLQYSNQYQPTMYQPRGRGMIQWGSAETGIA